MAHTFIEHSIGPVVDAFSRFDKVAVDIETTGLNPLDSRILLCQIGFPDNTTFVINVGNTDILPIMKFLESPKWTKIFHNAKFDTKFFLHYYDTRTRNIFDTSIAEKLINFSGEWINADLATLAKRYLNVTLNKATRESFIGMKPMEVFSEEQVRYAAEDSSVLFGLYEVQKKLLSKEGLDRIAEIEFELTPVVGDIELVGIPIDVPKWRTILEKHNEEHEKSRIKMNDLFFESGKLNEQMGLFVRDSINLNSPDQLIRAFKALGVDIPDTQERTIALLNHPVAKELLHYRGLQKIKTSYGETFLGKIHPFTGRIHPDFQQIGAETGRFSCRTPNVQQIPEEFRECVSDPNYKIVVADFSQIELRIIAELSDDPKLIQAFQSGEDVHKTTASLMFGIPIERITPEQRFMAKTINFGLSYGMGEPKFADTLNAELDVKHRITLNQAYKIVAKHKDTYKRVTEWLEDIGGLAYRQGYSTTIFGRKRYYTRVSGPNARTQIEAIKRQGRNSPIQGSNADITKLAMLNLYDDLKTYKMRGDIINQVHDEIVVLAHPSQAEAIKNLVVESMEKSAKEAITKVPVKVDAYINDVWKKG